MPALDVLAQATADLGRVHDQLSEALLAAPWEAIGAGRVGAAEENNLFIALGNARDVLGSLAGDDEFWSVLWADMPDVRPAALDRAQHDLGPFRQRFWAVQTLLGRPQSAYADRFLQYLEAGGDAPVEVGDRIEALRAELVAWVDDADDAIAAGDLARAHDKAEIGQRTAADLMVVGATAIVEAVGVLVTPVAFFAPFIGKAIDRATERLRARRSRDRERQKRAADLDRYFLQDGWDQVVAALRRTTTRIERVAQEAVPGTDTQLEIEDAIDDLRRVVGAARPAAVLLDNHLRQRRVAQSHTGKPPADTDRTVEQTVERLAWALAEAEREETSECDFDNLVSLLAECASLVRTLADLIEG